MIIKNANIFNRDGLWQILIKDGVIKEISKKINHSNKEMIDIEGKLLLPPFIDPHIHLDSILTGDELENQSGTLFEGIELWATKKPNLTKKDVKERAIKALKLHLAHGTQVVRTHVDITDPSFTALEALLEVKDEISPYLQLQIVAFPQEGIHSFENGEELLEESLKMGADIVGGIPHFEWTREFGVESIKTTFQLAEKYDRFVDIHCDETDDDQSRFIEVVAAEARRYDMGERVAASHTTAMHSYNNAYTAKLLRFIKQSNINMISNPLINIHLQGRFDTYPKRRGLTRVKEFLENEINISFGHDNIYDPWYPLGNGNMLQVLQMGLHACHLTGYDEINNSMQLITTNSAKTLGIEDQYGIDVGKPANMIILNEENVYEAVRRQPEVLYSIRQGNIILATQPSKKMIHLNDTWKEIK